jgi:hypothetical protein
MTINYQPISRNTDGSIVVEYPMFQTTTIIIPVGPTGLSLTGLELHHYISSVLSGLTSAEVRDLVPDPTLKAELALDKL